jgi:hypothetical protein
MFYEFNKPTIMFCNFVGFHTLRKTVVKAKISLSTLKLLNLTNGGIGSRDNDWKL